MLKMPALIREWKAVGLTLLCSLDYRTLLMGTIGWKEKLDQVAEIRDYLAMMGSQFVHKYVSRMYTNNKNTHIKHTALPNQAPQVLYKCPSIPHVKTASPSVEARDGYRIAFRPSPLGCILT